MPKLNGGTRLAGFILAVLVILGSVFGSAVSLNTKFDSHVEQNVIDTTTSHEEGCLPSRKNTTDVQVLKSELKSMHETMKAVLVELKKQ